RQGLHHDSLVAPADGVVEERTRLLLGLGDEPWDAEVLRHVTAQGGEPLAGRTLEQVLAVEMQDVEREGREGGRLSGPRWVELRAEAAHRGLERVGPGPSPESDGLRVQDDRVGLDRTDRLDDLRYSVRGVRERPRER